MNSASGRTSSRPRLVSRSQPENSRERVRREEEEPPDPVVQAFERLAEHASRFRFCSYEEPRNTRYSASVIGLYLMDPRPLERLLPGGTRENCLWACADEVLEKGCDAKTDAEHGCSKHARTYCVQLRLMQKGRHRSLQYRILGGQD